MSEFEKKVRALKLSEIIFKMIEGLENPTTAIGMITFGDFEDDVCFGCAATNAICKIADLELKDLYMKSGKFYYGDITAFENEFLSRFEQVIDFLRLGMIDYANICLRTIKLPEIMDNGIELAVLNDENYLDNLEPYRELARYNASKGN